MAMTIFSVSSSFLALARICAWHLESQAIVSLGCSGMAVGKLLTCRVEKKQEKKREDEDERSRSAFCFEGTPVLAKNGQMKERLRNRFGEVPYFVLLEFMSCI